MTLLIRKPGILTTIQDLGRYGSRRLGINPTGAMDVAAVRLLNTLMGNVDSAAVIESHFPAPSIEFDDDAVIAIGGADFGARVDGNPISSWSVVQISKGSVLDFAEKRFGERTYIAVAGGLKLDKWLGSASTNLAAKAGGIAGRGLIAGDRIECTTRATINATAAAIGPSVIPRYSRFPTVRIVAGNEFDLLTSTAERNFLRGGFTLTNDCNRMGYRLAGKPLYLLDDVQILSSAVAFGTIQLLPDGQIIILMADHQTTGGYPRIGHVIAVDLPLLAQCGTGDGVSFELVTIEDAERLALQFEKELNILRAGCKLRSQNAVH